MNQHATVYPGVLCPSVEFFNHKEKTKFIHSGQVKDLEELPFPVIETIRKVIEENEALQAELKFHHPESEWERINMFCKCRFGGLDFYPDMKDGKLNDGDYWDCPKRGTCRSEGIICKNPIFAGNEITPTEVKLIQLLTTTETNENIAEILSIPLGSFHLLKRNLYEKLGNIQTKQELAIIAIRLNLVKV